MTTSGIAHGSAGAAETVPRRHGLDLFMELASVMTKRDAAPLRQVDFTDLTLVRVGGRYGLLDRVEFFAATTLIAKQPGDTDEFAWQHVDLMVRSQRLGAVAASASGAVGLTYGPLSRDSAGLSDVSPCCAWAPG